jgi:hypothetical protein
MMLPIGDVWIDNVSIYGKPPVPQRQPVADRIEARGGKLHRIP